MKRILALSMAVLLLCLVARGWAATYYVDTAAADDTGNGTTEGTAWKTLDPANALTFGPGDRLLLRAGGEWTGKLVVHGNGTAEAPIVVGRYGEGASPKLWGAVPAPAGSWTKTAGRTYVYETALASGYLDVARIHTTIASVAFWHVWENLIFLGAAASLAACDATAGTCWYDGAAGKMYVHPTGHGDPTSNGKAYRLPVVFSVVAAADSGAGATHVEFQDLHVSFPGRYAFAMHAYDDTAMADYVTFRNCMAENSRHDLFTLFQHAAAYDCTARNCRANGAYVPNTPSDGLATDIRLERCVYYAGDDVTQYANGAFHLHHYADNIKIVNCESHGMVKGVVYSESDGHLSNITVDGLVVTGPVFRWVYLKAPSTDVVIRGYKATGKCESSQGVTLGAATRPVLSGCEFSGSTSGSGVGLEMGGTTDLLAEACIFRDFPTVGVSNQSASTGAVVRGCTIARCGYGYYGSYAGPVLKNCLFSTNIDTDIVASVTAQAPTSDYNVLHGNSPHLFKTGSTYRDLASWRTNTSKDAHSQVLDPLFVGAAVNDFHLRLFSPALTAGEAGVRAGALGITPFRHGWAEHPYGVPAWGGGWKM